MAGFVGWWLAGGEGGRAKERGKQRRAVINRLFHAFLYKICWDGLRAARPVCYT